MSKLIIQLVTWNGEKYIPYLFDSLRKQIFKDFHLYILDNGSSDNTQEMIDRELQNVPFTYTFVKQTANSGFAGGHNYIFKTQHEKNINYDYILLLNQDMYLTSNCIYTMVQFLDSHPTVAAVSPRLMRWNFLEIGDGLEQSFTHIIDALGLRVFRNRRVIEKYAGKTWEDKKSRLELSYRTHNDAMEVFGVSGALPVYRRSALETITFKNGTFFDELYESYKEDVDLAYRLRIAGFSSYILLDTIAYHDRSAAGQERMGDRIAMAHKKKQSQWVRYHSYKNHIATLYKNEYWQNTILDFPWILWYELKKCIYFLVFDRRVLHGIVELWKKRIVISERKKEIRAMRKISWKELRVWWK